MKELISFLAVILLILSTHSCRGEDITDEPFYREPKGKTENNLNSKKTDSMTILKNMEQGALQASQESDPPPKKDGIRWIIE